MRVPGKGEVMPTEPRYPTDAFPMIERCAGNDGTYADRVEIFGVPYCDEPETVAIIWGDRIDDPDTTTHDRYARSPLIVLKRA